MALFIHVSKTLMFVAYKHICIDLPDRLAIERDRRIGSLEAFRDVLGDEVPDEITVSNPVIIDRKMLWRVIKMGTTHAMPNMQTEDSIVQDICVVCDRFLPTKSL